MVEQLPRAQRHAVTFALIVLLCVTLALWLIRGPRPIWGNVPFLAISVMLTPLGYLGVYVLLYLGSRPGQISYRVLSGACDLVFLAAVIFLVASAAFAIREFINHRIIPPPNFLALGVALGTMRGWGPKRPGHRSMRDGGE